MSKELTCDSCGNEISSGDSFIRIDEMMKRENDIESKPIGYTLCMNSSCLESLPDIIKQQNT